MAQRIIVGFDGSPAAAGALTWAAVEAQLNGAELDALMVEGPAPGRSSRPPDLQAMAEKSAGTFPVTLRFGRGDAAAELIRACSAADLLVVGSHGRGPLTGLLLGSVSRRCLAHAPCPVIVVRRQREQAPVGRVIVGVDASEHSRTALCVAAEEARLRDARLDVIHAVYWDNTGYELITPTEEQLTEWGHRLVATELAAAGVEGNPVVVYGHARQVLERESAEADLLVMGERGHGVMGGPRLGSVSEYCARRASCPVMVTKAATATPSLTTQAQTRASDATA